MPDTRFKNILWIIKTDQHGDVSYTQAQFAVLMDIRDELQALNARLGCSNFIDVPHKLDRIERNTSKPKRKARK